MPRVPIIDITDLYHPAQSLADALDLIAAYALPEVELKAVILDATQKHRDRVVLEGSFLGREPNYQDVHAPRDPGIIPVVQLNSIFGRNVPFGVGPYSPLQSLSDQKRDVPAFQQTGIQLLIDTLRQADQAVEILSFASLRTLAAAYNREPELFQAKVRRIHISAGSCSSDHLEWNVWLDPLAMVTVLRSGLPLALYPCDAETSYSYGEKNTYVRLPNLEFIRQMPPPLQRYSAYVLQRMRRIDFLRVLDEDFPSEVMEKLYAQPHNVWETPIWEQVTGRCLVRRADGGHRLLPPTEVSAEDVRITSELRPCSLIVEETGLYSYDFNNFSGAEANDYDGDLGAKMLGYYRGDPYEHERAVREALPALFASFTV